MSDELQSLRRVAAQLFVGVLWVLALGVAWAGAFRLGLTAASVGLAAVATIVWWVSGGRGGVAERLTLAIFAQAQVAFVLYLHIGSPAQADVLAGFFVVLAAVSLFCSLRTVWLSAAAVAVHHVAVYAAAPDWIFPGEGGALRLAAHLGMLTAAAAALGIDLKRSYMVGDRWRDMDAGAAAGCRTFFIDYGYRERAPARPPDYVVDDLAAAARIVLGEAAAVAPSAGKNETSSKGITE